MDDDWDLPNTTGNENDAGVQNVDSGCKFTVGRGFAPGNSFNKKNATDRDTWNNDSRKDQGPFGWGNDNDDNKNSFEDNERNQCPWLERGGGRRGEDGGRRGGDGLRRGGGRGGRSDREGGSRRWGGDNDNGRSGENGSNEGGRNGGRGGGGNRRGGGRDRGDRRDGEQGSGKHDGEEKQEKPREIYIPPERNETEEEIFSGIASGVNFMKLDEIEVNVSGNDPPSPITSFNESGLRPVLLSNVTKSGYKKLTPIQKYSIPIIQKGRDLMGCAQTGSGKTAAFLLPIIHNLLENQTSAYTDGGGAQPNVVIASPTRELAIQIYDQARKFSHTTSIKTCVVYGGASSRYQEGQIQRGCHILVATPGRLKDFLQKQYISFSNLQYFILDEADRMLDMGFLPDVENILSNPSMPATGERQTLMFSATFPEEVQQLAAKFLHNYIFLAVGIVGSASTDVDQQLFQVTKFEKSKKLLESLKESRGERTLIFVETKRTADYLATWLSEQDVQTTSIHGDRFQREREQALYDFKKGIRKVMVATGVAARGLDIKDVHHVINYDLPKSIDEYVHRIGRTGRVGNSGRATSFYDERQDSALASSLAKILFQAGQPVPNWLGSVGGDSSTDQFGGRDIRGDQFGQATDFTGPPTQQFEEDW